MKRLRTKMGRVQARAQWKKAANKRKHARRLTELRIGAWRSLPNAAIAGTVPAMGRVKRKFGLL